MVCFYDPGNYPDGDARAVNAVLTVYIGPVNKLLSSLGGPIATSTTTGIYMVYGLLAYYIIRKPGRRLSPLRLAARFKL